MATEYGYRADGQDYWQAGTPVDALTNFCRVNSLTLIAREVSEPRIVSIRA